jgi:hypothetical protein
MTATGERPRAGLWFAFLAACACAAYARLLTLPLISDDYLVLWLGAAYGKPGGLTALFSDALYRCRAIFMLLCLGMGQKFGLDPLPYKVLSLILHVLNGWLLFQLGNWSALGWRISSAASLFFIVYQGHQEAVVWFAAMPDQLVVLFTLLAVHTWLGYLRGGPRAGVWLGLTWASFALSLLSKESAVVLPGVLFLVTFIEKRSAWAAARQALPFGAVCAAYFLLAWAQRGNHLHFNDGTFVLGWHFLGVIPRSMARMLWVSGGLALLAVLIRGRREYGWAAAACLAAMALNLLPYSFLTYMPYAPSRHTYLASIPLAVLAAFGYWALKSWSGKWAWWAVLLMLTLNSGYLWTKKYGQYLARAWPTEQLQQVVGDRPGILEVRCFEYGTSVVQAMAELKWGDRVKLNLAKPVQPGTCPPGTGFRFTEAD